MAATDYVGRGQLDAVYVTKEGWTQTVPRRPYRSTVHAAAVEGTGTDTIPANHMVLIDVSDTNIHYTTDEVVLYDADISGQVSAGSFTVKLGVVLENDGTDGTASYFKSWAIADTEPFNFDATFGLSLDLDTDVPIYFDSRDEPGNDTDFVNTKEWICGKSDTDVTVAAGDLILSLVQGDSDSDITIYASVNYGPK